MYLVLVDSVSVVLAALSLVSFFAASPPLTCELLTETHWEAVRQIQLMGEQPVQRNGQKLGLKKKKKLTLYPGKWTIWAQILI